MDKHLTRLLALARRLEVRSADLDRAVVEVARDLAVNEPMRRMSTRTATEAAASLANSGGLREQIGFLLDFTSPERAEAIIREVS